MKVLTLGTFDLFHSGHARLLARCADLAGPDEVIVGLNRDEFVAAYKGRSPVIPYGQRAAVLFACRDVDRVLPNPQREVGDSILGLLEELGEGIIAVGSDWRDRDYLAQIGVTQAELDNLGWYVVYLPYTEGISTTEIVRRVACA